MSRTSTFNTLSRHIARTACIAAVLAMASAAFGQQKLQIAGNFAAEHPRSAAVEQVFNKEVACLTNNQMQVDVFPAMQLGDTKENVDAVRSGALTLTWVDGAFGGDRIAPRSRVLNFFVA